MNRKCKTPGAIYSFEVGKSNSMHMRKISFSVGEIPSWVQIDLATAKALEKALHNTTEQILGEVWKTNCK